MNLIERIKLYKKLFSEKKFSQIINEIENFETNKTSQIINILGVCKMMKKNKSKEDLISANHNFKEAYLKEKNSLYGLEALVNFINVSTDLGEFEDSIVFYKEAEKNFGYNEKLLKAISRNYQFSIRKDERIKVLERIINNKTKSLDVWCSYMYINNFQYNFDQTKHFKIAKQFSNQIKDYGLENLTLDTNITKRKKILGFLSSDLNKKHSITYFLKGILEDYDKENFSIVLISNQEVDDKTFKEFSKKVDESINISNFNDIEALNLLKDLNIDILIDLMGVTSEQRIKLLNLRIAPIQILWLGYCNTSGIRNMDYIIADKNLIYEKEKEFYSEKILYLPEIWSAHSGLTIKRKEKIFPHIKNGFITFGSFNNFNKINEEVVKTWSNIIKKIQNSKLILKTSTRIQTKRRLYELFKKYGVDKSITFLEHEDTYNGHLELYNNIDIALDTFPYNGVTTSFEAVWMSVPVLTMKGFNFKSRCGESINKNLGLEELIAENEDDYISKARNLAEDKIHLSKISNKIYSSCLSSPLFDTKKFSNNFFKLLKDVYN